MASTIVVPTREQIANYGPAAADQVIAGFTAAAADIAALQALSTGTDFKESVRVATTTALAANTRVGNVLTANANGALGTIDGVTMVAGDRVLVKDEGGASPTTSINNGIYTITSLGGAGKFVFTRATDADTSAEMTSGVAVIVSEGTANAGKMIELVTADPIVLNTTAIGFDLLPPLTKVNGATVPAAGALTTGNVLQVTGAAALGYAALNLAGGVNSVTGLLPSANVSTLFTVGTPLTDTATTTVARASSRTSFLLAGTMSQDETITLGTAGAVAGDVIKIIRTSTSAHTAAIVNGGGGAGTLFTMPNSKINFLVSQYDGTNWLTDMMGVN